MRPFSALPAALVSALLLAVPGAALAQDMLIRGGPIHTGVEAAPVGVLGAGIVLEIADFPVDAGTAPRPEAATDLAMVYVPVLLAVYVFGLIALSFYNIKRADHLRNLETLRTRREGSNA